jgi:hypothetical protein
MALTLNDVKKVQTKKQAAPDAEKTSTPRETIKPWSKNKQKQSETRNKKFGKHVRNQATLSELDEVSWADDSDDVIQIHIGIPLQFLNKTRIKFQKISEQKNQIQKKLESRLPNFLRNKLSS